MLSSRRLQQAHGWGSSATRWIATTEASVRRLPVVLAACLAIYVVLALPTLGRPFLYDEVDFAKAGEAVARTGIPLYSRGWIFDYPHQALSGQQHQLALYHPPLYVYLLGAAFSVLGVSEPTARLVGLIGGAATIALLYTLGRSMFDRRVAAVAVLLYATSPYAIQSALLLDIDGAVLTPLALLFVLLVQRDRWVPATLVLGLLLWAKLTTPPLLLAGLLLAAALQRRPDRLVRLGSLAIAGAAMFLLTWLVSAAILGLPWRHPLEDTLFAFASAPAASPEPSGLGALVQRAFLTLYQLVRWVHPAFLVLALAALLWRESTWAPSRRDAAVDATPAALGRGGQWEPVCLLVCLVAVGALAYLVRLAGAFPKYQIVVYPLAALLIAAGASRWVPVWHARALATCILGATLAGLLAIGTRPDALLYVGTPAIMALWIACASAPFAVTRWTGRWSPYALALGLLLGANATTAMMHTRADYAISYFYGLHGWRETGERLAQLATPDQLVIADRDVAYYAGHERFVDTERAVESGVRLELAGGASGGLLVEVPSGTPPVPPEPVQLVASANPLLRERLADATILFRNGRYTIWQIAAGDLTPPPAP